KALDDRSLANARLADENGIVLRASAKYLLDTLQFDMPSDQWIELVFHRRFGQVPRELGQKGRLLYARQGRLLVEESDDVLADGVESHPLLHQDGRRNRTLLTQDAEQEVFRADVVVQKAIGLFGRVLEHALGFSAEGNLDRRRHFLAKNRSPFDLLAD